ncbi:uncharacterized protein LOC126974183 [Leptidea sinapis]|uniref:uncharacterized protein LOC126974183 n=1 Tax=Leptidea sinapis TaxID=189913 RepID=UPI0021C41F43|nr:uncharacterized protein LOC126974183 [Leptidea sinapis]
MRFLLILCLIYFVECKINKALTESLGQEVIEIGAPVKDLPDIEEEPSAESDDDKSTTTTIQVATKKDVYRKSMVTSGKIRDADKNEDEETRIEKELAEIYKDTSDYKSDSEENTITPKRLNLTEDKPIGRARKNFKFQPNSNDAIEVEKFRTSVDVISCEKNKLAGTVSLSIQITEKVFKRHYF